MRDPALICAVTRVGALQKSLEQCVLNFLHRSPDKQTRVLFINSALVGGADTSIHFPATCRSANSSRTQRGNRDRRQFWTCVRNVALTNGGTPKVVENGKCGLLSAPGRHRCVSGQSPTAVGRPCPARPIWRIWPLPGRAALHASRQKRAREACR